MHGCTLIQGPRGTFVVLLLALIASNACQKRRPHDEINIVPSPDKRVATPAPSPQQELKTGYINLTENKELSVGEKLEKLDKLITKGEASTGLQLVGATPTSTQDGAIAGAGIGVLSGAAYLVWRHSQLNWKADASSEPKELTPTNKSTVELVYYPNSLGHIEILVALNDDEVSKFKEEGIPVENTHPISGENKKTLVFSWGGISEGDERSLPKKLFEGLISRQSSSWASGLDNQEVKIVKLPEISAEQMENFYGWAKKQPTSYYNFFSKNCAHQGAEAIDVLYGASHFDETSPVNSKARVLLAPAELYAIVHAKFATETSVQEEVALEKKYYENQRSKIPAVEKKDLKELITQPLSAEAKAKFAKDKSALDQKLKDLDALDQLKPEERIKKVHNELTTNTFKKGAVVTVFFGSLGAAFGAAAGEAYKTNEEKK